MNIMNALRGRKSAQSLGLRRSGGSRMISYNNKGSKTRTAGLSVRGGARALSVQGLGYGTISLLINYYREGS